MLSFDDILNADDLTHEDVAVPEWGGTVRVRMLTGAERDAWEAEQSAEIMAAKLNNKSESMSPDQYKEISRNFKSRFCVLCMINEDGSPLFSDTAQGAEILGKKSSAAIDRVFSVAQKLNRVSDEDVEELAKNLEPDHTGD